MSIRQLPTNICQRKDGRYMLRLETKDIKCCHYSYNLEELVELKKFYTSDSYKGESISKDKFFEKEVLNNVLEKNKAMQEKKISKILPIKQYVYFVTDGKYVKIGATTDVYKRMGNLQTGNSNNLKLLYVIDTYAPYLIEHALHKIFKSKCVNGEWFDILSFFENRKAG